MHPAYCGTLGITEFMAEFPGWDKNTVVDEFEDLFFIVINTFGT
jgi:hypothetical protein